MNERTVVFARPVVVEKPTSPMSVMFSDDDWTSTSECEVAFMQIDLDAQSPERPLDDVAVTCVGSPELPAALNAGPMYDSTVLVSTASSDVSPTLKPPMPV